MMLLLHLCLKSGANSLEYLCYDKKKLRNLKIYLLLQNLLNCLSIFKILLLQNLQNLTIVNFKASLKHTNDYLFHLFLDEVDSYNRGLKFLLIGMSFSLAIRK